MTKLTIKQLKDMFIGGGISIANEFEYINQLNIFPVPDGDTGSNMKITTEGASNSIKNTNFSDLATLGKTYSRALLMNARGNSGVIFSQIMKGFVSSFKPQSNEITLKELNDAFTAAKEQAYKTLSSPIEGTILTVIRMTADGLHQKAASIKTIEDLFTEAVKISQEALSKTPEMLEQLKVANVVDSGGYGLCCFIQGMHDALVGKKAESKTNKVATQSTTKADKTKFIDNINDNNEGFGYCCEFILAVGAKVEVHQRDKATFNVNELKKELSKVGNCLAVVVDEDIVRVHVHSIEPYRVLQIGSRFGEFNKVKVENMTLQFLENNPGTTLEELYNSQKKKNGKKEKENLETTPKIIVTVPTPELEKYFYDNLKVDNVINYKTNGNPSIQEFLSAFKKVHSKNIILIVDDSNAMLAAKQAIDLMGKKYTITPFVSNDIAVTYLACKVHNPSEKINVNLKRIAKTINTYYAKVARASKEVQYSKIKIVPNDFIGIINKKIVISNKSPINVVKFVCDFIIHKKGKKAPKVIKIFTGEDVKVDDIHKINKYLSEKYSIKTEIIFTNQQIYSYHIVL